MQKSTSAAYAAGALALLCNCMPATPKTNQPDAGPSIQNDGGRGAVTSDGGHLQDAATVIDASAAVDAAMPADAFSAVDAGMAPDAAMPPDASAAVDAGMAPDVDPPHTDAGEQATCMSPGAPQTPTLSAGTEDDFNVTLLACTRNALALSCDVDATHQYQETIANGVRTIDANAIVNHDVGTFPNPDNPNTISAQTISYTMPVTPAGTGGTVQIPGILFSGAILDPGTAEVWNGNDTWRYEALLYGTAPDYFSGDATFHPNGLGLDCNFAHVQPGGAYHYHGVPTSMLGSESAVVQVGWAADGAPIFTGYGLSDPDDASSDVRLLKSSYRLKSGARPSNAPPGDYDGTFGADWEYVAGVGDLDECNGRTARVPIDGEWVERYHYVLTYTYPFIPRCTKFAADPSFERGGMMGGGPPGMGGAPPACMPGQTSMCCGDGFCGGPETAANCAADCG